MILNDQTSSFSVIRTNPKLTGNIKITIDNNDDIWLNTFDATKELSQDSFKRFPLESNSSYPVDLYKFLDKGNTPPEVVFSLYENFPEPDSTSTEYQDQYDFFYSMGAQNNINTQYEEDYSYLAPIWLRKQIPDYFIIFKISDPLDFPYNDHVISGDIEEGIKYKLEGDISIIYNTIQYNSSDIFTGQLGESEYTLLSGDGKIISLDENKDFPFDRQDHFKTILNKAEIIKTFDLTENSNIGKYIRNHINNPSLPISPIGVRFENQVLTDYRGIGYQEGIFTSKGEFLDDLWSDGEPLINFEKTITEGFERQGIICANLLNLEFLFNDDNSDLYEIPRYMGFYVSENDLGSFQLSGNDLYAWKNKFGNNEKPKRNNRGYAYQEDNFTQTNEEGVRLFINNQRGMVLDSDEIKKDLRLFYIKDKYNKFYSLNRNKTYGIDNKFNDIILKNKKINLKDFSGSGELILQSPGELTNNKGHGYIHFTVNKSLEPNDSLKIYWPHGDAQDSPNILGSYNEIIANDLSNIIGSSWGEGSNYRDKYFHPYGELNNIALAISKAINTISGSNFKAYAIDNNVILRMDSPGAFSREKYNIAFNITNEDSISINNSNIINDNNYNFEGGTDHSNIRIVKYPIENINLIDTDNYIKTDRGLSRISHIGRYVDIIENNTIKDFNKYGTLYINDKTHIPLIGNTKNFKVYNLYDIPFGVFTFFNVKELDVDFLDSSYNKSLDSEIHKYFNLKEKQPVLEKNKSYVVLGGGSIKYNDIIYPEVLPVPTITIGPIIIGGITIGPVTVPLEPYPDNIIFKVEDDSKNSFEIIDGDPIVVPFEYFNNVDVPIKEGKLYLQKADESKEGYLNIEKFDNELSDFEGFETFRELSRVSDELSINESDPYWKFKNRFNHKKIESEYNYLKENYTTLFSNLSRLVPFINKWVYSGGKDVRDNPYRLNTTLAFGTLNFSPSFEVRSQDPKSFTHEWYYLEKKPKNLPLDSDNFNYFDKRFDKNLLKTIDTNYDYFLDYFTAGKELLSDNNNLQERFSIFNYNKETGFSECLFKGIKIRIFDRGNQKNQFLSNNKPIFLNNSTKYNGYKFSSILTIKKPNLNKIESPVNIEIIENKYYKNITFVIELIIGDYRINIHDKDLLQTAINSPFTSNKKEDLIYNESILDYIALYSLKSQRKIKIPNSKLSKEGIQYETDDSKLNVGLNISFPSGTSKRYGENWIVFPFDNESYDWNLKEEIKSFQENNYLYMDNSFDQRIIFPYPEIAENDKIFLNKFELAGSPATLQLNRFENKSTFSEFTIPYSSINTWVDNPVFQNKGGNLFLEPIINKISLAEIAKKINDFNPLIKYTTVDLGENGETIESNDNFYFELLEPSTIKKEQELISSIDNTKPQEFQTTPVIGYQIKKLPANINILRYSGPYEPKFRNLIFFANQKIDSIEGSPSIDLKFRQTLFNTKIKDFGIVKNLGHLKISNSDILALSKSDKFDPMYPLIGESPIGFKDFYIFHSNWDPGFYQLYQTKFKSLPQPGTREMKELKNYFSSKIMKTRKSFKIEQFLLEKVDDINNVDLTLTNSEIIYEENNLNIRGFIIIKNAIIRFLREDGATKIFIDNIIPEFSSGNASDITDDIDTYLEKNVLPTYRTSQLLLYTKKIENRQNDSVISNISDKDKLLNGYQLNKNFNADKEEDFVFRFNINKDPSSNISISFSSVIEKI